MEFSRTQIARKKARFFWQAARFTNDTLPFVKLLIIYILYNILEKNVEKRKTMSKFMFLLDITEHRYNKS